MMDFSKILEVFQDYPESILKFAVKVVLAIIILILGRFVVRLIVKIVGKLLTKAKVELSVIKFLKSLMRVLLYIILIIFISAQLGIPTASFVAVLGSAGLAIGLALQGSLSNFAGGILILIIKPYKIGDYIFEGSSGREGKVEKIDLFYTTIVTNDNKMITIPNGKLANCDITNFTAYEKRRLDLNFSVGYDSDIATIRSVIMELVKTVEGVMKEEEILVFAKDFLESGIFMELRVWVKIDDYLNVKFLLNELIKKEFDKYGIEIPYNKLEVKITK